VLQYLKKLVLFGPVRVPEGVKLTSRTYCQFLTSVLEQFDEFVLYSQFNEFHSVIYNKLEV
jgi:hypothetical protein